jgi:hypothetical protein
MSELVQGTKANEKDNYFIIGRIEVTGARIPKFEVVAIDKAAAELQAAAQPAPLLQSLVSESPRRFYLDAD